ncbi:hypothetical protein DY000_02053214 [Brassica cretica]|uniref:Uncharacterized protein n=1 Tax=Brassica cretica TaxID=69181 RepID=A0ABQ7AM84_BRACR|nr:hypothetical protein DY000_02053214 [Brassica cretica]
MEYMIEKVLEIQQKTSAYLNLRLDVLYKELNGKFETLDAHVMMLDAQVSQTARAVKKQEALVKGKAVDSERHQDRTKLFEFRATQILLLDTHILPP